MKRISVIVPVYNSEKYISRCVQSILQSVDITKDEVILINDGSTDNSLQIINSLADSYPVIRVITKKNEGVVKTRQLGVEEAKGEYICFVDNDDYVDEDYFSVLYHEIRTKKVDLVISGYRRTTENRILFEVKGVDSMWFRLMTVAPWGRIYRKSFIINNRIEYKDLKIGEDIYYNFSIYVKTDKIITIPYTGYNWFYNEDSISNTEQKGFKDVDSVFFLLDSLFELTGKQKEFDLFYVRYIVWYLLFSGKHSERESFLEVYKHERAWLERKNIPFRFPVFSKMIKGEPVKNRVIIGLFMVFCRLGLVKMFARFYCNDLNNG